MSHKISNLGKEKAMAQPNNITINANPDEKECARNRSSGKWIANKSR